MIIDSHTHIFSPEVIEQRDRYCREDACFGLLYSNPKARILPAEDLIKDMNDKQIDKSVVLNIGWTSHDKCRRNNDYILEAIAKYPSRLIGFCSIQPLENESSLREIERCSKAGAKGVGELRPDLQGYNLCMPELMEPVVESLIKHNMILSLHASEPVGHEYSGKGDITPTIIYRFIKKYPELKLILAHFGGGLAFYELMPEVSKMLSNTYYDTAAAPFLYTSQIYNALILITGSGKLLFGSDWPLLEPVRVLNHLKAAHLNQDDFSNIVHCNVQKLLGV